MMTKTRFYGVAPKRFSRRWWLEGGKTFFWVAVVTILIWVYSDMEFTAEKDFRVTIRLTTGQAEHLMLLSRQDVDITFKARGNRQSLERYQAELNKLGSLITYDVSNAFPPGKHAVQTAEILRQNAQAGTIKAGLVIAAVSLSTFDLDLDRRITREVPVRFHYTGGILAQPAKITPDRVTVSLAESRLRKLAEPLEVSTVRVDLAQTPGDVPQTVALVPSIQGVPVTLSATAVQVLVKVEQVEKTRELSVAVRVQMPYTWLEDGTWQNSQFTWKNPADYMLKIEVTGPVKDVEKLQPKDVDAYITLSDEHRKVAGDSGATYSEATVRFHFPEGLNIRLVGEPPVVRFRLEKRKGT